MPASTSSLLGAAVAVACLTFVDAHRLAADEPAAPAPLNWPPGKVLQIESDAERRIRELLEKPIDYACEAAPLGDVIADWRTKLDLPIDVAAMDLAASGYDLQSPITLRVPGRPLATALNRLCRAHDLAYFIADDRLRITTKQGLADQPDRLSLRVYALHDLVVMPGDEASAWPQFESFFRLLEETIDRQNWVDNGGTVGLAMPYVGPGVLVMCVVQTDENHRRIENLFDGLRAARVPELAKRQQALPPPSLSIGPGASYMPRSWEQRGLETAGLPLSPASAPVATFAAGPVRDDASDEERRIRAVLEQPAKLRIEDADLQAVAAIVQRQFAIPVVVDEANTRPDPRLGRPETFTLDFRHGTLRSALRQLLADSQLTYVVRDDELLITSRTVAELPENRMTWVYPIADLVVMPNDPTTAHADLESLVDLLTLVIRQADWVDNGGTIGSIVPFRGPGELALVIEHDEDGHRAVAELLQMLRSAKVAEVLAAQARQPLPVEQPTAQPAEAESPPAAAPAPKTE